MIWGLEFDVKYDPFKFTNYDLWKKFSLFGNYTYNESRIHKFSEDPTLEGKLLTYTPMHSWNVGFNWLNPYLNSNVAVQYVGKMFSDSTNTQANAIDPHGLAHYRGATLSRLRVEKNAAAERLLAAVHSGFPGPDAPLGRSGPVARTARGQP